MVTAQGMYNDNFNNYPVRFIAKFLDLYPVLMIALVRPPAPFIAAVPCHG